VGREAPTHLKDLGYVEALRRWGWEVTWEHLASYDGAGIARYDLILWDGAIPERVLERVDARQLLVAMGGVGDEIAYYPRFAHKIACVTTSLFYFDEPARLWSTNNLSGELIAPWRLVRLAKYESRFTRFASPRFWRRCGIKFVYLPYASDPALFHPLRHAKKTRRWGCCGTLYHRRFVPGLMKVSEARGVPFHVAANELGTAIDPASLNEFYNSMVIGPNEHWHGVFGRELNQRVFDLGMAGVFQVSDMEWLAREHVYPYAGFYAGKWGDRSARELGTNFVLETAHSYSPEEIHEHFRQRHSFECRLAVMGRAIGADLSAGKRIEREQS